MENALHTRPTFLLKTSSDIHRVRKKGATLFSTITLAFLGHFYNLLETITCNLLT